MTHSNHVLIEQVRDCALCTQHLPLGAKPVIQVHPKARILITGQALGRKVYETGIPY